MSHFNSEAIDSPPQPWGVWPTLGISAIILGCFFVSGVLVSLLYLGWEISQNPALADITESDFLANIENNGNLLSWSTFFSGAMGIGVIAIAIKIRSGWNARDYLNLTLPKWSSFAIWNALLIALLVVEEAIARFFSKKSDFLENILASDQTNFFWLCLAVVIMAPLFEEIFFRGFMFKGMEKSWLGMPGTILITSFIWAVIHVQYDLFFMGVIFSLGLLLGYARYVTKSIWVPISMHVFNNGLAMLGTAAWLHSCIP